MKRTILFSIWFILGFTFLQNVISQTITITPLSKTTYCGGEAISIPFTVTGTFTAGNTFTAQLSDVAGSFPLTPYEIGTNSGVTSGTISGIVPYYGITGSNILIRILSTTPVITSATIAITINARPAPAYFTVNPSSMSVCSGQTATFSNSISTQPSGYTASWDFPDATDDHSSAWQPNGARIWNLSSGTTTCQQKICKLTITKTSTGCQSDTTRVITICPIPAMTSPASKPICSGDEVGLALTANISSTFKWKANNATQVDGESTTWQYSATISDILLLASGVNTQKTVTYTVIPTSNAGGCEGSPQTVSIIVRPRPSKPIVTSPVNYCKDEPSNTLEIDANVIFGYDLIWYSDTILNSIISPPTQATITAPLTTKYYVSQTNQICESYRSEIVVNVTPLPTANFTPPPQTADCANIPIQFNSGSSQSGTTTSSTLTYLWNFGDGPSGAANNSSQANPSHDFSSTIGCSTQDFVIKLTVKNIHQCQNEVTKTITVKQIPDASLKSDGSSGFQNSPSSGTPTVIKKCDAIYPVHELKLLNLSTTACNTNYNINYGDGTPYNGSVFDPGSHIYPSSGAYILTNTVIATNGCIASKTYDVYIGANPSGSIINPGGTILQHCAPHTYDFPLAPNVLQNTPGTIYTFNFNDGSPSITFNQNQLNSPPFFNSGGILYYPHTFNTGSCNAPNTHGIQQFNHTFYIKLDITNACATSSSNAQPIVLVSPPTADFNIQPATCTNTLMSLTNNSYAACDISWNGSNYVIDTNVSQNWIITPSTYSIINGNLNSSNLTVSFLLPGIYSIKLISTNNCSSDTITKTICVSPNPVPGFTLNQTSFCNPDIVNITNTTNEINFCSPFPTDLYTWDIICTNTNCDGSDCTLNGGFGFFAGGSNQHSKNPILQFNSPGVYKIKLTVKNGCSPVTSAEQTITVKDKPFIQTLTLSPTAPYCLGDNICADAVVKDCYGATATIYNWTSTLGNFPNPNQLNPGCITANTLGAQSITLNTTNECGTTTKTENFNITQLCNNNPITGDNNICQGQVSNTYSIQSIPNATTYNWSMIPQNAGNITGTDTSVTIIWNPSFNGAATLSVYGSNGVSNSNTSILNVNIKALPIALISGNATLCQNATITLITINNPQNEAISVTYTTNNVMPQTISIGALGTITIAVPNAIIGSFVYKIINVQYQNAPSCTNYTADSIIVTIISEPNVIIIPNNPVICTGGNVTFTANSLGGLTSGYTYQWQQSSSDCLGTWTDIAGAYAISFTTPGLTTNTCYRCVVSQGNTAQNCTAISNCECITVIPLPTVNSIQTLSQSFQTFCNGDTTAAINFTGTGTTYNWTNSNPSIGLAANGIGNIPSFTAINTGTTPNIGIITITPYSQFCSGFPITDTIIVNPTPNVVQPTNLVFCNGDLTSLISFTGTGTSYVWTNNNTSIGLAAVGTGDIPSFIATNTGTTPLVATITVTPKYTFGGITCYGTIKTFTITVGNTPIINPIQTLSQSFQTFCNGDTTAAINFTGTGTTYNWTNSNPSIGLAANGTGNIPSFTAINTGTTPNIGIITITPYSQFCSGFPITDTIIVNPTPNVIQPLDLVFCNGYLTSLISFTGTGTSYDWTNNNTSIGLAANGNSNIPSFTASNTGTTPIIATITVTPKYTNGSITCFGTSKTFTITINPLPVSAGTISGLTSVCQGDSNVNYSVPAIANTTSYIWTLPNGASGTSTTNSISLSYGLSSASGNLTVKGINSCGEGGVLTLAVTVNPKPPKPIVNQVGNELISSSYGNQWYNLATGLIPNANGQLYFPQQSGYYFTIATLNACSSDTSNIIYFDNTGILFNSHQTLSIKVIPNPFKDKTSLVYTLQDNMHIRISIMDVAGKELKILCDKKQQKGEYNLIFNADHFSKGIYFYKIYADNEVFTGKLILIK